MVFNVGCFSNEVMGGWEPSLDNSPMFVFEDRNGSLCGFGCPKKKLQKICGK